MQVKELREFLNVVPENMTQEEFDELEVVFPIDERFVSPCEQESGIIEFTEPCDAQGNRVHVENDAPFKFFGLMPHGFSEEFATKEEAAVN